jgi:hypothetical protein
MQSFIVRWTPWVVGAALGLFILNGMHKPPQVECVGPAAPVVLAPVTPTLRDEHIDRELKDLHQQLDSHERRLNVQSQMIGDLTQRASLHHHEKNGQAVGPFENPPHQTEPQ